MSVEKSFVISTEHMSDSLLEANNLLWDDTKTASDHLPVIVDFIIPTINPGCLDEEACNYNNALDWPEECLFPGDACEGITIDNLLIEGVLDENCDCIFDNISISEMNNSKNLMIIIDLIGRRISTHITHGTFLYIYDDGSIEKKHIIK